MKQYRLLKDLPGVKAGVVIEPNSVGNILIQNYETEGCYYCFSDKFIEDNPDWFEEVAEQKMKKYKLLKDYFNNKAGDIVELPENMWFSPDWFEEVKPFEWTDELVKKSVQFYVQHEKNKPLVDIIEEFKQQEKQ